jgi:hypothetical protein
VCVACISHTKYASKVIHGEITDIPYFKFRRLYEENEYEGKGDDEALYLRTHFQFDHLYFVSYYRWFVAFVKSRVEHLNCIAVELVGKARPVECERHEETVQGYPSTIMHGVLALLSSTTTPVPSDDDNYSRSLSNFSTPSPTRSQSLFDNSPPSLNRISRKSVNLSESGWKQSSGLLNTRDELLMSLMASEAVVDSRGFDVLTAEEVEDYKKVNPLLISYLQFFVIDTNYRNISY